MASSLKHIEKSNGNELLDFLKSTERHLLFIYFSRFNNRVTAISVYDLQSSNLNSFSIYKAAQQNGINLANATEADLLSLEIAVFKLFFSYINQNQHQIWVHWMMSHGDFSFDYLYNRYRNIKLNTKLKSISNDRKVDLEFIVASLYTKDYFEAETPDDLLIGLCRKNGLSVSNSLSSAEEEVAHANGLYQNIESSTSEKAVLIAELYEKLKNGNLKVPIPFWRWKRLIIREYNVMTPKGFFSIIGLIVLSLVLKYCDAIFERESQRRTPEFGASEQKEDTGKISKTPERQIETTEKYIDSLEMPKPIIEQSKSHQGTSEDVEALQVITVDAENSAPAFGGELLISVSSIHFSGSPLHHFVTARIISKDGNTASVSKKDVGHNFKFFANKYKYVITVMKINTYNADFHIRRIRQ